ncbi:MAG TPA: hypothetical protein VFF33_13970 [Ignavibacteriaceae bacterium]|nr:hypothetical protein [Ignavibacteriaceae bacterium]
MNRTNGFYISRIVVSGSIVKPAELVLSRGFNVISGLSDTGKSYIFSCINYMLGGADIPKDIPEGKSYSSIKLEIKTFENDTFTLTRDLKGGVFTVKKTDIDNYNSDPDSFKLKSRKVRGADDNISTFLLKLCGFDNKYVKKNLRNETRELSFRDIVKLTLIDETKIITEKSPIHAGQYTEQTQELSVLEILLTGNDSKGLEKVEEAKVYAGRIKGKIEFVDSLIRELYEKISKSEKEALIGKKEEIQVNVNTLSDELFETSKKLEVLTQKKREIFNLLNELRSKDIMHEELYKRFQLLKEHYKNDLMRLEFITQGEDYFSQLKTIKCPLCGGEMDKDHYNCIIEDKKSPNVINSVENEIKKIKIKLIDLESTINESTYDKSQRDIQINQFQLEYDKIETEIQSKILPIKSSTMQEIDKLINQLSLLKELDVQKQQLTHYYGQKNLLEVDLTKKPKIEDHARSVNYDIFIELSKNIKNYLRNWNYTDISTVNFDSTYGVCDIVLNGKNRKAHGKGVRAITYTAFILGLMEYCIENGLPHSRLVVIDSPLTTYHGKDADSQDEISHDMQDAFFKNVATINNNRQIIILDNKEPPEELKTNINYIHFTGDRNRGRAGFFP